VENDVENGNETKNPIGIFTVLNIVIDIQTFLAKDFAFSK